MKRWLGLAGAAFLSCAAPTKEVAMKQDACCSTGCCRTSPEATAPTRRVPVEFLYLDLSTCGRCQGTERRLDEAVAEIRPLLQTAGIELDVRKIHVATERQARELGLLTSPTIRVMGRDVQIDFKESACGECGDLADCDVDCRVWTWQGKDYAVPPKEMLADALLRAVYGDGGSRPTAAPPIGEIPENLERFFRAKAPRRPQ